MCATSFGWPSFLWQTVQSQTMARPWSDHNHTVHVTGSWFTCFPQCSSNVCSRNFFDHTRHILPPSDIYLGCFGLILHTWKGNIYFTELAEREAYGKYVDPGFVTRTHVRERTSESLRMFVNAQVSLRAFRFPQLAFKRFPQLTGVLGASRWTHKFPRTLIE